MTVRLLKPGESIPRELYRAYLTVVPKTSLRAVEQMAEPVERGDPRAIGVGVFNGETMVGFSLGRHDQTAAPIDFAGRPDLASSNYTTRVHTYIAPGYTGHALDVLNLFKRQARQRGSDLLIISDMNQKSEAFITALRRREGKRDRNSIHIIESPLLKTKNAYIRL